MSVLPPPLELNEEARVAELYRFAKAVMAENVEDGAAALNALVEDAYARQTAVFAEKIRALPEPITREAVLAVVEGRV